MNPSEPAHISCPYCGELNSVVVYEVFLKNIAMVQDCEVCCQPIDIKIRKSSDDDVCSVDVEKQ